MPGIHQLPGLAIRDMYRRLRVMQGFSVPRRSGWNCHGLAVEVAVERELGLSGRQDIEAYGTERFVARCREYALRHADAISALRARMGYWTGAEAADRTMDDAYVESAWRSLRRIFDAGLLARSRRVVPYCPRCQTPLSAHDLRAPGALKTITTEAVIVRFRLATLPEGANPQLHGADLLVRTTAPWTLAANAAIAVHPHQSYAIARRAGQDDRVIVAESRLAEVLGEDWHVAARVSGGDLAGATYRSLPAAGDLGLPRPVIPGYFVAAGDGTGLMHLAPAYGADDLAAGLAHELEVSDPIGADGRFDGALPLIGGMFFADADQVLIGMLSDRGLIFACRPHHHAYPHCWRCGAPLLFRALPAWHIRTTAARELLCESSERVRWVSGAGPGQAGQGPDGAWLGTDADWALSRTRYWGTPLPLWQCEQGHVTCVGSRAELADLAGRDLIGLDPHRPCIDAVTISCPRCGTTSRRVPDVIDAWYDAGSMPFAQHGPAAGPAGDAQRDRPADLLAESADQARDWFGALLSVGVLGYGRPPFGTALRLGAVLDDRGRPMTSGLGNLVEPLPLIERHGADAVRWFLAAAAPAAAVKMSDVALADIAATVLLSYWNAAAFLVGAAADPAGPGPAWRHGQRRAPPPAMRPMLDRWILSELQCLVRDVTADLADFDSAAAAGRIAGFLDALASRYLRWCRRRFGPETAGPSRLAALATLDECLDALTRIMAPITPFLADHVWELIAAAGPGVPDSVHLTAWPIPVPTLIDDHLASQVALAGLAQLGRSARAAAAISLRQPLARAAVAGDGINAVGSELIGFLADQLGVASVEILPVPPDAAEVIVTTHQLAGWIVAAEDGEMVALDITQPA